MATITAKLKNIMYTEAETAIRVIIADNPRVKFLEVPSCIDAGVAIQPYGVAMVPDELASEVPYVLTAELDGTIYTAAAATVEALEVGDTLTLSTS